MSQNIIFEVVASGNVNYGTLQLSHISYEDGSSVTIQKFLGLTFKVPKTLVPIDCYSGWQTSAEFFPDKLLEAQNDVSGKVYVDQAHTFIASDTLTIEVNGDLMTDEDVFTKSFKLYVDDLPSGTVKVEAAAAPDPALADADQVIYLKRGTQSTPLTVTPGATKTYTVDAGSYDVEADELANSDETVVATATVSPSHIDVLVEEESAINVTYGAAQKYSALDVSVGSLASPIDKEQLHVQVIDNNKTTWFDGFLSSNTTKHIRRLPVSGSVDVSAQITLNNVKYSASQSVQLSNNLIQVSIDQSNIKTENVDTTGFVDLPVRIVTDITGSHATIPVRLTPTSGDAIYSQEISIASSSTTFGVLIAPGSYNVKATGFVENSTVYTIFGPILINVNGNNVLELETRQGASLAVKGFPDILSFGGLTDLVAGEENDFIAANAYSLFKYAGSGGDGNPTEYLTEDPATTRTIELAETVAGALGHPVLPVMISYTVNLSGGDADGHLQKESDLAHSFANLILSMNLAQETANQSVPVGYIVNPDFLGECQKDPRFTPGYTMPVRTPLQEALDHWKVNVDVPDTITDTLKGYVLAVNWLIRTIAPGATFGWQVNLWGVGSSAWIYEDSDPATQAKSTASYINSLEVYGGEYSPDFLAVDRYEGDDFTIRGYTKGYCFGPYEWGRFYDFCDALSFALKVPVMPWQIPASRIPSTKDTVGSLEDDHWGTGGTYIFGDPAIGDDYQNIHPRILAIEPQNVPYSTVEDIFKHAQPFDLSYPTYGDFPRRGIFTVLLGGGQTTGIASDIGKTGKWTQQQVSLYMENPIPFSGSSS